jgi:hypothetical protein
MQNNGNNQLPAYLMLGTDINQGGVGSTLGATIFSGTNGTETGGTSAPVAGIGGTNIAPAPTTNHTFAGEPFAVWIWLVVLLLILKFASEHKSSPLNPADIQIGGYNVLTIGIASSVFIVLLKVISTYVPLPGLKTFSAAL